MDNVPFVNAPSQPMPAAALRPDQSRAVESGGVITTRVDTATPTPSSLAQQGAVTKSQLSDSDVDLGPAATNAPERVLKPYGVAMLPDGPVNTEQDAPQDTATSSVEAEAET